MSLSSSAVIKLPFLYSNDLPVIVTGNTTLTIGAGQCRDSTNSFDMVNSATVSISTAVVGAGGLDTGTIAASTWYAVYLLTSPDGGLLPVGLLSTSATAPSLPYGYSIMRLLRWQKTDGSSHLLANKTVGKYTSIFHEWDSEISVLTAGTASTYTAVDLSPALPPIADLRFVADVSFTPATAADFVEFRPTGSSSTANPAMTGAVAAIAQRGQMQLLSRIASAVPKVDYQNSAASGSTTVKVYGFFYEI